MMGITWRDLENAIHALPESVKDLNACVWYPLDYDKPGTEFPEIIGICAYDGNKPYSVDNFPSLNIEEGF